MHYFTDTIKHKILVGVDNKDNTLYNVTRKWYIKILNYISNRNSPTLLSLIWKFNNKSLIWVQSYTGMLSLHFIKQTLHKKIWHQIITSWKFIPTT